MGRAQHTPWINKLPLEPLMRVCGYPSQIERCVASLLLDDKGPAPAEMTIDR